MRRLVMLPVLLTAAFALAEPLPTEKELYSTQWWLQKSLTEAAKVKAPAEQFRIYNEIGNRAAAAGDVALAEPCVSALEKIPAAYPKLGPAYDPSRILTRAKVVSFGQQGQADAALALVTQDKAYFQELAGALATGRHFEVIKALAIDKSRPSELSELCAQRLLFEAVEKRDKPAAVAALELLPKEKNRNRNYRDSLLGPLASVPMGKIDPARARFVFELIQNTWVRSISAAEFSSLLSKDGFTKDALDLAMMVSVDNQRTEVMLNLCRAMAKEGNAAEARKIIDKEEDNRVKLMARYGLSLGLAEHGEVEAATIEFNAVKKDVGQRTVEFEPAVTRGTITHGDFKAGVAALLARAAMDTTTQGEQRAQQLVIPLNDCVEELIKLNRLDDAAHLVALYPETRLALTTKANMYARLAKLYKEAKNEQAFQKTLKEFDAVVIRANASNGPSSAGAFAAIRVSLSDLEESMAIIAALGSQSHRDNARHTLVNTLAAEGDFKNVQRVLDSLEEKPPGAGYVLRYTQIASIACMCGHIADLPAWIATWPDPEARAQGFCSVVDFIPRIPPDKLPKAK